MDYQTLFNTTLKKIRLAASGALECPEPLMKTIVKIMYDFSDDLKRNGLIFDSTPKNSKKK